LRLSMESKGILRYGKTKRLAVEVDEGLAEYYRSFIPKSISYNVPMHSPHITVVRGGHETPKNVDKWGLHEGEEIVFQYDPYIHVGETYIWLAVDCKRLEEIRDELGLDGCFDKVKWFHVTIANMKKI